MSGVLMARFRMTPATVVAMTVGVTMIALPTAARAQASSPQFGPATVAALNSIVKKGMTSSGTPGMAVGIWVPGKGTYIHSFGTDNVKAGSAFAVDDHVRIASITKTFTATAILELADRGQLKLSDHLSSFVKGIPYGRQITIRQLLNMTAGVYDFTNDAPFLAQYQANPLLSFSAKNLFAIISRHRRDAHAPGTTVEYSDSNYYLLGLIVQKVTHRTLASIIQTRIIDRLHLRHTSYPTTPRLPTPFSHGYFTETASSPLRDVTLSNPNLGAGAGAMISTLGDVKLWAKALATGTLLTPATQTKRLQTVPLGGVPGKISLRYGLGILKLNGFLGHNGAILGYGSAMFYLPSAHATFVVEGNRNNLSSTVPTDVFVQLADYLFPRQFPNGI
jgi:D-alanyl-D-alanine carboxypeptidase